MSQQEKDNYESDFNYFHDVNRKRESELEQHKHRHYWKEGLSLLNKRDYEDAFKFLKREGFDEKFGLEYPFLFYFIKKALDRRVFNSGLQSQEMASIFEPLEGLASSISDILSKNTYQGNAIHYTSLEALRSIIDDTRKNNTEQDRNRDYSLLSDHGVSFRLYKANYMNDPQEGQVFKEMIGEAYPFPSQDRGQNVSRSLYDKYGVFIGSFVGESSSDDELLFWRLYGKSNNREATGCSMVFSKLQFEKNSPFKKNSAVTPLNNYFSYLLNHQSSTNSADPSFLTLQKVMYEDENETKKIVETLRDLLSKVKETREKFPDEKIKSFVDNFVEIIIDRIRYLFKSKHYAGEKEVRLIVIKLMGNIHLRRDIHVDNSKTIPRLYVSDSKCKFLVEKIVFGPCACTESEFQTWKEYLNGMGIYTFPPIPAEMSKIDYRG